MQLSKKKNHRCFCENVNFDTAYYKTSRVYLYQSYKCIYFLLCREYIVVLILNIDILRVVEYRN